MSKTPSKRIRYNFSCIPSAMSIPSLIGLQKQSYEEFLQKDIAPGDRKNVGLQNALTTLFPVQDFSGKVRLEFDQYTLEEPKHDLGEAREKSLTYAAPLRAKLKLMVFDEEKAIKRLQEQDVYLGDIPIMTEEGTFVVNGVERVVVSQMHRSPGVFFDCDRSHGTTGRGMYMARIIPAVGSWMDFECDAKDMVYVRIDRKRKILVTTLLMALAANKDVSGAIASEDLGDKNKKGSKDSTKDSTHKGHGHGNDDGPNLSTLAKLPGMSREEILEEFYTTVTYTLQGEGWRLHFTEKAWKNARLEWDLVDADTGEIVAEKGKKLQARFIRQAIQNGVKNICVPLDFILDRYLARDFIDQETGEVLAEAGDQVTKDNMELLLSKGSGTIDVLDIDYIHSGVALLNTLLADKNTSREEALTEIYRLLRPGESPTIEAAYTLFHNLFFNPEKYSLSNVGRLKLNTRLDLSTPLSVHILEKKDLLAVVHYLLDLRQGLHHVDDIDSLTNRRVRSVGELLEVQYRSSLARMQRSIRERIAAVDFETAMPNDLLSARPLSAVIREFFGTSQLSQFMDQTNPLSAVSHKRRVSALGPGGLTRDRAGIEVRDVHPTHYGRICPVETPEGSNIGLINSMAIYARVNEYGFLETPYRHVVDGRLTNDISYLSAMEEEKCTIVQADVAVDKDGRLTETFVGARCRGDFVMVPPQDVNFADVSPKQILSVAAALIPFVENDDAHRVLTGSNMQRQAVPLLRANSPLVGTGIEGLVIRDSGVILCAKRDGVVDQVDAQRIVIRPETVTESSAVVDIYHLDKYRKSNAGTCIHQKPLVRVGQEVKAGDIIADGAATDRGELALGYNALVAFMLFHGGGFEDSIVLSQRLVNEDAYTSIHIDELETSARDMKLGYEEITRDIPGVSDEAVRHLDEAGVAHIGADVGPGDILVGKVSPRAENPLSPEEKLLRAIFSDKAADMKDTSLRVPAGMYGTVVDVRIFSRRGVERDERSLAIEREAVLSLTQERDVERRILEQGLRKSLQKLLVGQTLTQSFEGMVKGTVIGEAEWRRFAHGGVKTPALGDEEASAQLALLYQQHHKALQALSDRYEKKVEKLYRGDDLPTGVLKTVKVFLAIKRKIQPGDKMAGRHGNKGVVSIIVPQADMPFLADGTPVDIVLNPLGLPSRMNVGQILETHLGWASFNLGKAIGRALKEAVNRPDGETYLREYLHGVYKKPELTKIIDGMSAAELLSFAEDNMRGVPVASPAFEGAKASEIETMFEEAGVNSSGQEVLYNGRTGEPFDRPITVGVLYMLKLHHLVDEKIHARSVGPYSLVTQQPLGGKSQFGGQRFGEMEVWALQAYGAARTLLEMLTVKSDDLQGRMEVYKAIIKGQEHFTSDVPESFNVLIKELKTLGMNVECRLSSERAARGVSHGSSRGIPPHSARGKVVHGNGFLSPSANSAGLAAKAFFD